MAKLTEQRFNELRDQAEEAQRAASKAEGARDQLLDRLKDDFGCDSLEVGKTLLKKLQKEEAAALEELDEALADYERKWKADAD